MFEILTEIVVPLVAISICVPYIYVFVSKSLDHLGTESRIKSLLQADAQNELTKISLDNTTNNGNKYK